MKKFLFLVGLTLFSLSAINAQGIKIGVNGALPVGDADEGYSFGALVDFSYLFEVSEDFHAGPTAGVIHYFGSSETIETIVGTIEVDFEDATFLPIGGSARYTVAEGFILGADLGYGIGLAPDGNDGGFYYRPKAIYMVSDVIGIGVSYSGISVDGGDFSSINAGIEIGLE